MKNKLILWLLSFLDITPNTKDFIFAEEMLVKHNYGLYIINKKCKNIRKNPGYAATVSWKLTYQSDPKILKYTICNFLTDGWVYPIGDTYKKVCEWLNNNPNGEKYRIMTKAEVLYLISQRKQGFL